MEKNKPGKEVSEGRQWGKYYSFKQGDQEGFPQRASEFAAVPNLYCYTIS